MGLEAVGIVIRQVAHTAVTVGLVSAPLFTASSRITPTRKAEAKVARPARGTVLTAGGYAEPTGTAQAFGITAPAQLHDNSDQEELVSSTTGLLLHPQVRPPRPPEGSVPCQFI